MANRIGDLSSTARSLGSRVRSLTNIWGHLKSWVVKCSTAIMDHGLISASNFLLGIVLARYLGSEQYGAYALAFSTFVLLSLVHSALAMEPMSVFAPSIYRKTAREYLGLLLWVQIAATGIIVALGGGVGVAFRLLGQHSHLISALCRNRHCLPVCLGFLVRETCVLSAVSPRASADRIDRVFGASDLWNLGISGWPLAFTLRSLFGHGSRRPPDKPFASGSFTTNGQQKSNRRSTFGERSIRAPLGIWTVGLRQRTVHLDSMERILFRGGSLFGSG